MRASLQILLVTSLGALIGCAKYDGKVTLDDVTKLTRVTLRAPGSGNSVIGIKLVSRGQVTGAGRIKLILNGKPYRTEDLEGNVRFTWSGDWYSPLAEVQYEPQGASGGRIELHYRFDEL